ncbi:MAG: CHAD domain-containing protein [Opitutaceae bacterium]|nr:CHAD domain-containing protein [Opitutaceae bacterium]
MSYRFRKKEDLVSGARRIVLEELDAARLELVIAAGDAEALHEVRKRIKRMRALMRLCWDGFAGADGETEDEALRDVGRLLAAHRESDALIEILRLEAAAAGSVDLRLLEDTVRLHQAARAPLRQRDTDLARAHRVLGGVRRRMAGAAITTFSQKECLRRLRRSYRRARDQWWLAVSDPTDEHLHEWRKLTKYLLNQLRLIRSRAGPGFARFRANLADLDNRLGQARDAAHLAGILRGVPVAEVSLRYGLGLRARLEQSVDDQLSRSFALGRRLFRFGPRGFQRRVVA